MRKFQPAVLIILVALFSLNFWVCGCDENTRGINEQESVKVVTTIFPLADIVRNIGGEEVEVSYLLPSGASPHTFDPTVEQMKKMSGADVFVHVGGGLDDWATEIVKGAPSDLEIVELTEGVQLKEASSPTEFYEETANSDHSSTCKKKGGDPHIWLDPLLVRDEVLPRLEKVLAEAEPAKEDYFSDQRKLYTQQLTQTHAEIEKKVSDFSSNQFITYHSAWKYFADRYGLEEAAVIAPYPGQEPSAAWMAELVGVAEEIGACVIFCEPQLNPAVAKQLAEEIGGEVAYLDPLGGEDLENRNSYIELLLYNIMKLEKALG